MEVKLLAGSNLPTGAVCSIRAGTVRRQAAVNTAKPFRFPSKPLDSPLKVEIFKPVGTAYVVLRPGEDQYKIRFANLEQEMSCEVHVKPLEDGKSHAAPLDESIPREEMGTGSKEAQDYLEGHQVLHFIQALLQTLVKEKPADPYSYMARHFANGYDFHEKRAPIPSSDKEAAEPAGKSTQETANSAAPLGAEPSAVQKVAGPVEGTTAMPVPGSAPKEEHSTAPLTEQPATPVEATPAAGRSAIASGQKGSESVATGPTQPSTTEPDGAGNSVSVEQAT